MKRAWLTIFVLCGCLGPQDDPSQVHDLRVIAASFDPPEIMGPNCAVLLPTSIGQLDGGLPVGAFDAGLAPADLLNLLRLAVFGAPVSMSWLVLDPQQRDISWELRACTSTSDLECNNDGGWVSLAEGTRKPGTFTHTAPLGATFLSGSFLDGGQLLVNDVINNDAYRGLGGVRVPVVLHVTAGEEQVFAQKLMVFSCQFFPEQRVNVQPMIPRIAVNGDEWPASTDGGPTITLSLDAPELKMEPLNFGPLEEDYVLPSLMLERVNLKESWKFAWHTSLGRFTPVNTGGTDFTGMLNKPYSRWLPRIDGGVAGLTETDVDFWIVVRDGRGGESWLERRAHFIP